VAPGATAYVFGPHGTWIGSAGIANVSTGARMPPDARLRIQSVSKTWLLVVMLQLAKQGKVSLDDTVARWLLGLLPHHGSQVTIRELMNDTSGLIDDDGLPNLTPSQAQAMLARVKDPKLRAELVATVARLRANRNSYVSPLVRIKLADWQPLVAAPGTTYHHSNIGWNVAGLIAARVAGEPLPALYQQRLFAPLGLTHTTYQPQGPIAGTRASRRRGRPGELQTPALRGHPAGREHLPFLADPEDPLVDQQRQQELRTRKARSPQERTDVAARSAAAHKDQPVAVPREQVCQLHRHAAAQRAPDERRSLMSERDQQIADPAPAQR
jgi:CubicO group peptidase (beta-lactamase class C family)